MKCYSPTESKLNQITYRKTAFGVKFHMFKFQSKKHDYSKYVVDMGGKFEFGMYRCIPVVDVISVNPTYLDWLKEQGVKFVG